jgi:hypothetical protein
MKNTKAIVYLHHHNNGTMKKCYPAYYTTPINETLVVNLEFQDSRLAN